MTSNRGEQSPRFQVPPKAECEGISVLLRDQGTMCRTRVSADRGEHGRAQTPRWLLENTEDPREMAQTGTQTGSDHVPSISPDP